MSIPSPTARIESAWRTANEAPVRDLISMLLARGLTEAIDAVAAELGIDREAASLLVFQHGLPEPLPRCA